MIKSLSIKTYLLSLSVILPVYSISINAQNTQNAQNERVIRYQPDNGDFVIRNGKNKFNRSLYGTNTEFRVEAGDVPELALYMPGMGGNLKFALVKGDKAIWIADAADIETRYRPGSMIYSIADPILGSGKIRLTVLAMCDEEGMMLKLEGTNASEVKLMAVYGGASNEVFRRAGERNVDAADCFFLKAKNCKDNVYELNKNTFSLKFGKNPVIAGGSHLVDKVPDGRVLLGTFPESAALKIKDVSAAKSPVSLLNSNEEPRLPVLCAEFSLKQKQPFYFSIHNPAKYQQLSYQQLPQLFQNAEKYRESLVSRLSINTPDKYLNAMGGALAVAADGIWQDPSYLHGAISWRVRIPGWRAAYAATALNWSDRAKTHFEAYANSQLTAPASGPVEMDSAMSFGRVKMRIGNSLFSSGYICPNPNSPQLASLSFYDMNLAYIDELLRNIFNTGDLEFAKKMWPTLERHLAWEKRTFDADGDGLYDAFACIWASDALQYNGGGVTHSSAYNCFHNKCAAQLATLIGQNAAPYQQESEKILKAINSRLWLKEKGQYAEFVDALGLKSVHESAGLWTVYHAIDSEIADQFQQYQALRYVDTQIPHIPFNVKGLENEHFHAVTTTNWMPYYWSINNVAPAEQFHTALAYWQGGRNEEAYTLLKSMMMDQQFCGSSPGNFPMLSIYNAASRNESYRDFADVIGIASRTIVEGLIGLRPDAVHGKMTIKPGFPASWDFASFSLPYLDFGFNYSGQKSKYSITQKRKNLLAVYLQIPAKSDKVAALKVNGKPYKYNVLTENVGMPVLEIELPAKAKNSVEITWAGNAIDVQLKEIKTAFSETKTVDMKAQVLAVNDPQSIVSEQKITGSQLQLQLNGVTGERTLFAKLKQGEMTWWQPIHVSLNSAVEMVAGNAEDAENLNLYLKNNTDKVVTGTLTVGKNSGNPFVKALTIQPNATSDLIQVPAQFAVAGTNNVEFVADNRLVYSEQLVNWALPVKAKAQYENLNISGAFNDKVTNIFAKNKYLSPRSPYTTLQLPLQGMGDWCVPLRMVALNDSGFRAAAKNDLFVTPFGLKFATPNAAEKPNIAFASLWDNYPDSISVPLTGKASHAYLLMAGSTNHMQSRMLNGLVSVKYTDGTESVLKLINPETWAPIERDYFTDNYSYKMSRPRPYRVVLKTGKVARDLEKDIKGDALDARLIDGGGAIILDLPLDINKELKSLTLTTKANEVVIGLMGITLERNF